MANLFELLSAFAIAFLPFLIERFMLPRLLTIVLLLAIVSCGGGSGGTPTGGTAPPPNPQPPPPGPPTPGTLALTEVASGFTSPLALEPSRDGTGRLFVVEQGGQIRIIQNGAVNTTPFLNISSRVVSGGERGLLGVAFHPSFSTNRKFYVNYTRNSGAQLQTVIAEFLASESDPNQADPSTERILLTVDQPFANHNGGQLAFGPDGFLYIGLGDGGSGGDPQHNGQNTNRLLGKILRIDVSTTTAGKQYGIPADNPFATSGGAPEIYAYGFRNPWRFSFDLQTSRLFVADVGQESFEEVDIVELGKNYGWNIMEGLHCYRASTCDQTGLTPPILEYSHSEGEAVTGGFVYRGTSIPALVGSYVMGDFGSGRIWRVTKNGSSFDRTLALSTSRSISSFGQDENNELYVVDYSGKILRLTSQ